MELLFANDLGTHTPSTSWQEQDSLFGGERLQNKQASFGIRVQRSAARGESSRNTALPESPDDWGTKGFRVGQYGGFEEKSRQICEHVPLSAKAASYSFVFIRESSPNEGHLAFTKTTLEGMLWPTVAEATFGFAIGPPKQPRPSPKQAAPSAFWMPEEDVELFTSDVVTIPLLGRESAQSRNITPELLQAVPSAFWMSEEDLELFTSDVDGDE